MVRLFWSALIFLAVTAVAEERAVQLLLPSRQLEPTSTFELRFANEMVAADQIGKPAALSPLVFAPAMEGQFLWLSARSGTFAPKGVPPLGTKYQILLRPGLKDAAGRAVTATLKETAETPPMRVKGVSTLAGGQTNDAPAMPRYLILFNANVKATACAKFFWFANALGARIDARVGQAGDAENRVRPFETYQSDDQPIEKGSLPEQGCNVEFTEITLDGTEMWQTLGFEAFGSLDSVESSLRLVTAELAKRNPPMPKESRMAGYPAWLNTSV